MEHFDNTIQGWNEGIPTVYKKVLELATDNSHFVEVGSWKGKSAAYMAVEIMNGDKTIKFDCVDTWLGDINEPVYNADHHIIKGTLYEHFIENMKPVEGYYTAIRLPSIEASKLYEDNSLDFVFIDAAHDYENVKADIAAWMPKIKDGGILAGHDYHHPPVIQAVRESISNITAIAGCWLTTKGQ